jgi:serine phosphatase RsbU (regulator of sigma subunit)
VYEVRELPFGPDALLFASTDGLVEARRAGELFGQARVSSLVAENAASLRPQALVELAYAEAASFADALTDDIAIIALRRS